MNKVVEMYFGSKLYGTDTPLSDLDFKGIYLPEPKEIILGKAKHSINMSTGDKHSKNTSDDIDLEIYSLQEFIRLAIKGETIALDMIHTPDNMINYLNPENAHIWEFIRENRSRFYTTDMKAYLGYVKKQAAKYGIKGTRMAALRQVHEAIKDLPESYKENLPWNDYPSTIAYRVKDFIDKLPINEYCSIFKDEKTGSEFYNVMGVKHQLTIKLSELKEKVAVEWNKYGERARQAELNQGIDWKAMHHAIRGGQQLQEIYLTGDLQYPLADRQHLKDIKAGKKDFKEVSEYLEHLISEVDRLSIQASKNGMPSKVDVDFWETFVYNEYRQLF